MGKLLKKSWWIIVILIVLTIKYASAQDVKPKQSFLNGALTVESNTWSLSFINNQWDYFVEGSSLVFTNKENATEFYNDLITFMDSEGKIVRDSYMITSDKKMIVITNTYGQFMVSPKKYMKKGLEDIKESLNYL